MRINNYFPAYQDEGEVVAGWGEAKLIKYLDGRLELRGGSREDQVAAREWMSMFWHEAVLADQELSGRYKPAKGL